MADTRAAALNRLIKPLRVPPGTKVVLRRDHDPGYTGSLDKKGGRQRLSTGVELLAEYQTRLAAQDTFGLLVVLQGLDASGKDSTVRHVMSGVNPQGVVVHSFKVPSEEELGHDYLWRHAVRLPARGQIGIFNRSHYEEVLVVRVHADSLAREHLPPAATRGNLWKRRYDEINEWERYLVNNGIRVVKLLLNVGRDEQRKRFLDRIDRPDKHWKFSASDVAERQHWDEYQRAMSEMLSNTSTDWAPWFVIPADHKWFSRAAVAAVVLQALIEINPQYPKVDPQEREALEQARVELDAEAPGG